MQHATTRGSTAARGGRWPHGFGTGALWMCLTVLCGAAPAAAADAEPRVARVAFVEGETSYLNADADEWTAVEVNAPLVTGDRFWSGSDGRAEIQLPGGVDARLASDTEVELLEVSDQAVHVKVGIGTATFRLREAPAAHHVELSTPTTALVARARGVYRVDVTADGQTTVAVREGEADAYLGDERYRLGNGRGARIVDASYVTDDVAPIEVFDATQVPGDPWDDWEAERAARLHDAASYQYVDDDVYGVADLDHYGSWDRHETYGPIWRPTRVSAGWAPFTQGRWVWQDPWGWTWVDYEPWGWAPSHHGRWVYVQDAWAWAPGPVVARPVYAPATVGFLGVSVNTPSVSVSVGIGPSVGWVPLGWGEPLIPWWGGVHGVRPGRPWWGGWGGPRIVNNNVVKNITNVNVTNIEYTNIDRGFTAVSRDSFVRGDLQRIDVPRERRREAFRPLRGAPEVIPARDSLFAARPAKLRGGRGAKPPEEILRRAAVSTRDVQPARPEFGRKLQLIERGKGAPVAPQELRRLARESAQRVEAAPRVRTVAAKGRKPVVPEVTASAPERLDARPQRAERPGGRDERAARRERGDAVPQREARQQPAPGEARQRRGAPGTDARPTADERRDEALGERRMPVPGRAGTREEDPRSAAREDRQRQRVERAQPEQQRGRDARVERGRPDGKAGAADERAQPGGSQRGGAHDPGRELRQMERTQPQRERAAGRRDQAAPREPDARRDAAPRASARPDEAQRRAVERAPREQVRDRETERARREGVQREQQQAKRAQQEDARRQQAARTRRESMQRTQADDARRAAEARAQRDAQAESRRQRDAQAERVRQAGEARQRQDAAQRRREDVQARRTQAEPTQVERKQAERRRTQRQPADRQREQRQQAERQRVERQKAPRQQAQRQAPAQPQAEDPRRAEQRDDRKQKRRALPEG